MRVIRPTGCILQEAQDAATRLGIQVQPLVLGSVEEIDGAFAAMRSELAEALIVQPLFLGALGQGDPIGKRRGTERGGRTDITDDPRPCQRSVVGGHPSRTWAWSWTARSVRLRARFRQQLRPGVRQLVESRNLPIPVVAIST